eukprot:PhF_6_TR36355/c0_g1_i1/m.53329
MRFANVILVCLYLSFTPIANSLPDNNLWSVTRHEPTPRDDPAVTCSAQSLMLHGGSLSGTELDDLWAFDSDTYAWNQIYTGGEDSARKNHGIVSVDDKWTVLTFGQLSSGKILSDVMLSSATENSWLVLPKSLRQPQPRRGSVSVSISNGFILLFGRTQNRFLNDVWSFTFSANEWTPLFLNTNSSVTQPSPRMKSCCARYDANNSILCFGGQSAERTFNDIWIFSLVTNAWRWIAPVIPNGNLPRPVFNSLCSILNEVFFVVMGSDSKDPIVKNHHGFSLQNYSWMSYPLPSFSGGLGCAINNILYIYGPQPVYTNNSTSLRAIPVKLDMTNALYALDLETHDFTEIFPAVTEPPALARTAFARVGDMFYVIWGETLQNMISRSVWRLDLETEVWSLVKDTWAEGRVATGRIGSMASTRGNYIVIFGGYEYSSLNERVYSNELLYLDVGQPPFGMWHVFQTDAVKPSRRAFASILHYKTVTVVFGGENEFGELLEDLWVYEHVFSRWQGFERGDGPWPSGVRGATFFEHTPDLWLVGGGHGARWKLNISMDKGSVEEDSVSWLPLPLPEKVWHRKFASHWISNPSVIVTCGGTTEDDTTLYPPEKTCFFWNGRTGDRQGFTDATILTNVHSAAYTANKNKLYIFGGIAIQGNISLDIPINALQYIQIPEEMLCDANHQSNNHLCFSCASGSYYDVMEHVCVSSPKGYYTSQGWKNITPCEAGTFSDLEGSNSHLSCLPCPTGYYQPSAGQDHCKQCPLNTWCLFQTVNPEKENANINYTAVNSFPAGFALLPVPGPAYVTFQGVGVFVIMVMVLFYAFHRFAQKRRLQLLIPKASEANIEKVYNIYNVWNQGLKGNQLFLALTDLGARGLTDEYMYYLVRDFDRIGIRVIFLKQFYLIIAQLVEEGKLSLHEGPPPKQHPIMEFCAKFSFKHLDLLKRSHRVQDVGEPLHVIQNHNGGIMTVLFILTVIIDITLLLVTFLYGNVVESRASLPAVVAPKLAYAKISVTVRTQGFRYKAGCVTSANECLRPESVKADGFVSGDNDVRSVVCAFQEPNWCVAEWACSNCSIGIQGKVDVVMGWETDWFASIIVAEVRASAGVDGDVPAFALRSVTPDTPETVFLGFPGTSFYVEVTPTLMQGYSTTFFGYVPDKTGYHLRFLDNSTEIGRSVSNQEFQHVYLIPISVILQETENFLVITRTVKTPLIDLVSMILGGISGMAAGFGIATGLLDRYDKYHRKKKIREAKSSDLKKHRSMNVSVTSEEELLELTMHSLLSNENDLPPEVVSKCMRPLLESNLTLQQAYAIKSAVHTLVEEREKLRETSNSQSS